MIRIFRILALTILFVPQTAAADSGLGAPLCEILKELLPKVKTFRPEGAQAQLVMSIGQRFNYDPEKLQQVQTEIDQATTSSCSKEREDMLVILKSKSLAESVR